jgi:pimeloyl-ACP methyl ester carboxylesterase
LAGKFAHVNGTRLYYEEAGSGAPAIFIHGFTLDTRMWDTQFDVFARRYRAIRYDARGFGKSNAVGDSQFTHGDDLKALMDHLGIQSASLIGLSMGGRIAIEFALKRLDYVTSLVLVDAATPGFPRQPDFAAAMDIIARTAKAAGREAAIQEWLTCVLFQAENERPALAAELARTVGDYSGEHWLRDIPMSSLQPGPLDSIASIKRPTLVVVGGRDLRQFHENADLMLRHIDGAEKLIIPGAGHMSNMCEPEIFNEAALAFLDKVYKK